jgi:hypothetical protein
MCVFKTFVRGIFPGCIAIVNRADIISQDPVSVAGSAVALCVGHSMQSIHLNACVYYIAYLHTIYIHMNITSHYITKSLIAELKRRSQLHSLCTKRKRKLKYINSQNIPILLITHLEKKHEKDDETMLL